MTMSALVLEEGDTVEIIGKRSTAARAVAPYKEDEGLDILRIDGLQRANAGVGSGDFVTIRKTDSRPAQRVVFAPAQQNFRLQGNPQGLKRRFFHTPLAAGAVIPPPGQQPVARGHTPPPTRPIRAAPPPTHNE